MKGRAFILLTTLVILLVLTFAGCGLLSMTIEQRIKNFVSGLNAADRSQVYQNFSSSDTQDYGIIAPSSYWDIDFTSTGVETNPYVVTSTIDPSDPSAVYVTIDGPPLWGGPNDYMFVMVDEGTGMESWKIHELWFWNGSAFVELIK